MAIATDGSIFVAETEQSQVKKFDPQGAYVGAIVLNRANTVDGYHLVFDAALNLLAVTDSGIGRVAFIRGPVTARLC